MGQMTRKGAALLWDSLSLFVGASKSKVNGFPRSERPILDP